MLTGPPPRIDTRTNRGRDEVRLDARPGFHQDPVDHRVQPAEDDGGNASRRTLGTAAGCRLVPVGPPVSWTGRRYGLAEEDADELGLVFRPEG
jgi:hypothetical protein